MGKQQKAKEPEISIKENEYDNFSQKDCYFYCRNETLRDYKDYTTNVQLTNEDYALLEKIERNEPVYEMPYDDRALALNNIRALQKGNQSNKLNTNYSGDPYQNSYFPNRNSEIINVYDHPSEVLPNKDNYIYTVSKNHKGVQSDDDKITKDDILRSSTVNQILSDARDEMHNEESYAAEQLTERSPSQKYVNPIPTPNSDNNRARSRSPSKNISKRPHTRKKKEMKKRSKKHRVEHDSKDAEDDNKENDTSGVLNDASIARGEFNPTKQQINAFYNNQDSDHKPAQSLNQLAQSASNITGHNIETQGEEFLNYGVGENAHLGDYNQEAYFDAMNHQHEQNYNPVNRVQFDINTLKPPPSKFVAALYYNLNVHPCFIWSDDGKSIVITQKEDFTSLILPNISKTSEYSGFIRMLNGYGFRKKMQNEATISKNGFIEDQFLIKKPGMQKKPKTYIYKHPRFLRERPDLLNTITRSNINASTLIRLGSTTDSAFQGAACDANLQNDNIDLLKKANYKLAKELIKLERKVNEQEQRIEQIVNLFSRMLRGDHDHESNKEFQTSLSNIKNINEINKNKLLVSKSKQNKNDAVLDHFAADAERHQEYRNVNIHEDVHDIPDLDEYRRRRVLMSSSDKLLTTNEIYADDKERHEHKNHDRQLKSNDSCEEELNDELEQEYENYDRRQKKEQELPRVLLN